MKKLYLLRHQKTLLNIKGVLQGSDNSNNIIIDSDYIEKVESNKKILTKKTSLKVYASTQKRALQTVESYNFDYFTKDERIVEYDFGVWEGKHKQEMLDEHSLEWYHHFSKFPCGEGFESLSKRINDFLYDVKTNNDKNILIVSHGLVLRYIYCLLNEINIDELNQVEISNNTIYEVRI